VRVTIKQVSHQPHSVPYELHRACAAIGQGSQGSRSQADRL